MDSIKTIWDEQTTVRSADTDFLQRWKLSGFFAAMQEVASHHAAHLGYDYRDMLERDTVWVLSRAKVRFHAFPQMGETVHLQTWPKGLQQKIFFMRDFFIIGADGHKLADASLAYVLINTRLRRVLPPSALGGAIPDNNGRAAIAEPLEKIPTVERLEEMQAVQANYSAVDLMGHVNNARYIDWISDCFTFDQHRERMPMSIQINYINEVRPGEQVRIFRGSRPDDTSSWYMCGENTSSGSKAFDAEFRWS